MRPFIITAAVLLLGCQEVEPDPAENARQSIEKGREALALLDSIADPNDPESRKNRRDIVKSIEEMEKLEKVLREVEANQTAAPVANE